VQSGGSRGYITTADADPRSLYHDVLVAIDPARQLNNGHPSSLASFLDFLQLHRSERVFHVGCGLGYYTAIIAHVVGSGGHVIAVDIDPELALRARSNLAHLGNVTVAVGDGVDYDPGEVDAIFINAGFTHPQSLWLDRLHIDGRLLVPITFMPPSGPGSGQGQMVIGHGNMLLVRHVPERYEASFVSPVSIYSSPSGRDANYNQALGQAYREMMMGKRPQVKSLRRDSHPSDTTCWLHREDVCLSTHD
jgi:protein-L-isoaspartate(D-aspartate) O-methyltransferase